MDKSKAKHHAPPDIRLAKVFQFTGADLAANRSGYKSTKQRGLFDSMLQSVTRRLSPSRKSPPPLVSQVCGHARLNHYVVNREQMGRPYFNEYYHLTFDSIDLKFALSAVQFRALSDGILYRVYYDSQQGRILSLERVNDCANA